MTAKGGEAVLQDPDTGRKRADRVLGPVPVGWLPVRPLLGPERAGRRDRDGRHAIGSLKDQT